ncbi:MAG: hypothetical protein Q9167_000500 [Letrouitia subvulpina]
MSPSRTEPDQPDEEGPGVYDVNLPYKPVENETAHRRTEFPEYLPSWDDRKFYHDHHLEFDYEDPANRAAVHMPQLLKSPKVQTKDITPKMGTIISGLNLRNLSDSAKDELAMLISKRKIVVFRDQLEFLSAGPAYQQKFMAYFGKPNIQPVTGSVKGHPGFHIIHRDNNQDEVEAHLQRKMTSTLWHQDVSYEPQPPGYIMLGILACPDVGGDTVFADTEEAYRRLSPEFQKMIDGLKAFHTSKKMIDHVKSVGGFVRRPPVSSIHPIVRVHPVTGKKSLWINSEFVTGIEGLKEAESELLLKFLIAHVVMGHDFQARVQWQKHSVVMFDGRNTLHTATVDYDSGKQARHIFRLASMTEKPIAVEDTQSG